MTNPIEAKIFGYYDYSKPYDRAANNDETLGTHAPAVTLVGISRHIAHDLNGAGGWYNPMSPQREDQLQRLRLWVLQTGGKIY